jgi:hypothetical protein
VQRTGDKTELPDQSDLCPYFCQIELSVTLNGYFSGYGKNRGNRIWNEIKGENIDAKNRRPDCRGQRKNLAP